MTDGKDKKFISKLKSTKENLYVLEGMLQREEKKLRKEIELVEKSNANISDLLYELTGDEFYRNKDTKREG